MRGNWLAYTVSYTVPYERHQYSRSSSLDSPWFVGPHSLLIVDESVEITLKILEYSIKYKIYFYFGRK